MKEQKRVVITGVGVCSPIGVGMPEFEKSLRQGRSGIVFWPELEALNFRCQVGGQPALREEDLDRYFKPLERKRLKAQGVIYGAVAALEAWDMAGLSTGAEEDAPHWQRGTVFGTGLSGISALAPGIDLVDAGKVRRLGSGFVEQVMPSGISAYLSGRLGLGNWVSSNASACSTGTEALVMALRHLRAGAAEIMLAGGCDDGGPHSWGGFDAMRVLNAGHNATPQEASRPMAADANGFVPGSGGGALVLETLESAERRGAPILAEVLGGALNSGGQRQGGTMTAPNAQGVQRCLKEALRNAAVRAADIDLISGHLTSTMGDVLEIQNWSQVLGRKGADFPVVNALKSLTGHCLSAAGAIELVALVWQLHRQFVHPSINCDTLHPEIESLIEPNCIPRQAEEMQMQIAAKSSFGFGDVNSCTILKKWEN